LPTTNESHPSTSVLLEVERFEHASAGAERVLLRVDGTYTDRPGKRVLDAMLFVDDGLAVHRHAPLPDSDEPVEGWLWRAAFDVPASYLTDERTRFALESDPGRLIDLPYPSEIPSSPAVPLTARAAYVARRYAAAIAVVLTVALAPGGMPAHARTEVLRVTQADGSVIYMTTDGRTLQELPPDAVVIDRTPPAPAPTPSMNAGAPAAPAPDPPQAAPSPSQPQPSADSGPGLRQLANDARKQGVGGKQAARRSGHPPKSHGAPAGSRSHGTPAARGTKSTPGFAAGPTTAGHPSSDHRRATHHQHHQQAEVIVPQLSSTPPTAAAPLQSLPLLAVNDPATLQPLSRLGHKAQGAGAPATPAAPETLPTKGLQPLATLGGSTPGGPAHDGSTPTPQPGATPDLTAIPELQTPVTEPAPAAPKAPSTRHGNAQDHSGSHHHLTPPPSDTPTGGHIPAPRPLRHPDGSPTRSNPTFFDALPGPAPVTGVPNFVIQKFHVPPFLLPIYQAAGIQYGIRWEVLAAINEIETDYGRNLNVSSAGALGWMQFMPATWKMYGVDANKDGKRDPYNPVDAIFAAARYLKAAGGDKDIRKSIFAYNHAGWYVDSVMLRARLIAGYPADLIGSLTGLTEGRFPVAAHARYADDLSERAALKHVKPGQNAANVVDSSATRRGIDIFAKKGSPVVAVNDGVVKEIGKSKKNGLYVVLQDVYGNRYTYSGLGSLSQLYPVPKPTKSKVGHPEANIKAVGANDPKPTAPASAGAQRPGAPAPKPKARAGSHGRTAVPAPAPVTRVVAVKQRLFAHPHRAVPKTHGGLEQILASGGGKGFETYDNYFSRALGLNSKNATLKRLKKGSHVIASTVLGRVGPGDPKGKAAHVHFEIRPAGRGAPRIDPKPILDGWKLLESTAVYRAKGKNVLYGDGNFSIGEIMLLPKPLLVKRVLSDPRIDIYAAGRQDIATGQIDRRVLIVLAYLADSGMKPTVSCLRSGHSLMTASGNVSEHSSGNAVDISAINGIPIAGHQDAGGITEQAVRRLMMLQGTIRPHQIISLLDFGQNTLALPDHADHIHVGFHPLFGSNTKLGRQTQSVLKPGQWDDLVQRLGQIQNPSVPTHPSKYAIPDNQGQGE
jgi:murein DD-endopeptidase MepM/ murein hydrolase activator NlpD